jgi:hypothetical protein
MYRFAVRGTRMEAGSIRAGPAPPSQVGLVSQVRRGRARPNVTYNCHLDTVRMRGLTRYAACGIWCRPRVLLITGLIHRSSSWFGGIHRFGFNDRLVNRPTGGMLPRLTSVLTFFHFIRHGSATSAGRLVGGGW